MRTGAFILLLVLAVAGTTRADTVSKTGPSKQTENQAVGQQEQAFALDGEPVKGKKVYESNCIACHGLDGDGKGPLAGSFDPAPADFTDLGRMSRNTDRYLYTIVKDGGLAVGKCIEMGAWRHSLTDEQIRNVVAYIKTFSTKKPLRREYL